jgi:hypothetical protein
VTRWAGNTSDPKVASTAASSFGRYPAGGEAGFTLRTNVHLLDEGLGDADEAVTADPSQVNAGSTEGSQTAANAGTAKSADMAL